MRKPIGVILARGGSKGIIDKNLQLVGGKPLVVRSVETALAGGLELVYCYSDSKPIRDAAEAAGAVPVARPRWVSEDDSTSEKTMAQFIKETEAGGKADIMMIQCTTPFLKPEHIRVAVERFMDQTVRLDSIISVCELKRFLGYRKGISNMGGWVPSYPYRWLRQENKNPLYYIENGGFYLTRRPLWREGRRIGDHCGLLEMHWWESMEIDDPEDLAIAQAICGIVEKLKFDSGKVHGYAIPDQEDG
jgi:CMP-N-acetylneuraminic acid synthetase